MGEAAVLFGPKTKVEETKTSGANEDEARSGHSDDADAPPRHQSLPGCPQGAPPQEKAERRALHQQGWHPAVRPPPLRVLCSSSTGPCVRRTRSPRVPTCCRKVRSDKGKHHNHPESDLRIKVVAHARLQGYLVFGSLNDVVLGDGGASMDRYKREGLHPGAPDLMILEEGGRGEHGIAIELKIGNNTLSEEQELTGELLKRKRWGCASRRADRRGGCQPASRGGNER